MTRLGIGLIALSVGFNIATLTVALAGTENVTYYLKGTALPVAGMSTTPVSGPLDDFNALGDDDKPGRTLDDTDKGIAETNKDHYQQWEVPADALTIDGPSTLVIWIAAKDFDPAHTVSAQIFLLDCPGNPCTQLATATQGYFTPGSGFAKLVMTFPPVEHTFGAGRRLAVRIVYPKPKGDAARIWLAYAASSYPASLTITIPGSPATTSTTPAPTTTSIPGGSTTTSTTTLPWGTTTTSSTTLPWGTTTTSSSTLPIGSTTTVPSGETTSTGPGVGQGVATTTVPGSPDARPVSSWTEKSSLVVKASSAGVAADLFDSDRRLSPQEGLEVSFLSAAEAIKSQFLASTGLGVLGGLLVVMGMRRRLEEDEDPADIV